MHMKILLASALLTSMMFASPASAQSQRLRLVTAFHLP